MSMPPDFARSVFMVLRTARSLQVAAIVVARGPINATQIHARLLGRGRDDVRSVRHSLLALERAALVWHTNGFAGVFDYQPMPALTTILREVQLTDESFIPRHIRPPEPSLIGAADGPECLGL